MNDPVTVRDFIHTKKQKQFETDFFKNSGYFEKWEDCDDEGWVEGNIKFEVELEDILAYSQGIMDRNPLFNDPEAAKEGPFGEIIAHPLFLTQAVFWATGVDGPGSWIKTPGAINPGQKIEFLLPVRVGDVLSHRSRFYDKFIKRGKRYLTYNTEWYNQNDDVVCRWLGTLIIPVSTGEDTHKWL